MLKVGLIGYGKAGQAVASVLSRAPDISLQWIVKRQKGTSGQPPARIHHACTPDDFASMFNHAPVDAIIDFSHGSAILQYGAVAAARGITILSANSEHTAEQLAFARTLGSQTRIMCCPNITLGINFLLLAAKALQNLAPYVDVAIVEEHFRSKPETSGTAKRLAASLGVPEEDITSLRLGGVIGHHEVVFGFPYQTVRLTHDSISREAFGTGAIFALNLLLDKDPGFHLMEQLMLERMLEQLKAETLAPK